MGAQPGRRRCLVTGATGFIGSHLVDALLRDGWEVRCLVRSAERARHLAALPVELSHGDVTDPVAVRAAVADVDYVFHSAGLTKASSEAELWRANAQGTRRLVEACASLKRPVLRLVLVSSLSAAGPARDGVPLTEDAPPRPVSSYGRSKLESERAVLRHGSEVPFTIIRPPAVYGPRDSDSFLLFRLAASGFIPTIPPLRLSLVHVTDLVTGILAAATSERAKGRTYFVSGGNASLDEVFDMIAECLARKPRRVPISMTALRAAGWLGGLGATALGIPSALNPDKVREVAQRSWLCSTERARDQFGYEPGVPLKVGISGAVQWYRQAGWL